MSDADKKRFLVMYMIPISVLDAWQQTDAETRKPAEQKMHADWQAWMGDHAKMIVSTEAAGKTKRVTLDGISESRNEIMLYSVIEAETHEAAAKAFENHPHLQIPQASIEIMAIRPM